MHGFSSQEIKADISFLIKGISESDYDVPSVKNVMKISLFTPVCTVISSLISVFLYYLSTAWSKEYYGGFWNYFFSDGWVFIAPCIAVGFVFFMMTYNNALLYLSVPKVLRGNSLILVHLKGLASKIVFSTVSLMFLLSLLTPFLNISLYLIPAIQFLLLFVVNIVIGLEVNRLGVGFFFEKLVSVIKKI